jgi:hypothetical protein
MDYWRDEARRVFKAELTRRGVTYEFLAWRLQQIGIKVTERAIANKMSRGSFTFAFALQCLAALEVRSVTFELSVDPRIRRSVNSLAHRRWLMQPPTKRR